MSLSSSDHLLPRAHYCTVVSGCTNSINTDGARGETQLHGKCTLLIEMKIITQEDGLNISSRWRFKKNIIVACILQSGKLSIKQLQSPLSLKLVDKNNVRG